MGLTVIYAFWVLSGICKCGRLFLLSLRFISCIKMHSNREQTTQKPIQIFMCSCQPVFSPNCAGPVGFNAEKVCVWQLQSLASSPINHSLMWRRSLVLLSLPPASSPPHAFRPAVQQSRLTHGPTAIIWWTVCALWLLKMMQWQAEANPVIFSLPPPIDFRGYGGRRTWCLQQMFPCFSLLYNP